MRTMYDSVDMGAIPGNAAMVAYYTDGVYANEAAARTRFPEAILVGISAIGTNTGTVGDCEPGCMTEAQLVSWVAMRRAAGVDPTAYINQSNWGTVSSAFRSRGVPEPHYWVARYDNNPAIPSGAVAKQYIDPPASGGHYDLSSVVDFWPGVDTGSTEDDMILNEGMKIGMAHTAFYSVYQRGPSQQEMTDFANTLNADGSNYGDLVQGLANNAAHPDIQRIAPTTLAGEIDDIYGKLNTSGDGYHTHTTGGPVGLS